MTSAPQPQNTDKNGKPGLRVSFMRAALFGAATMGLTGCVGMPSVYTVPRVPLTQPLAQPLAQPLPAPVMPQSFLPAGVTQVAYYGGEAPGSILVDIGRHKLYHVQHDGSAVAYPIASPRNGADIPPFDNVVTRKAVNPTWTPTENMRARNPALPAQVPGGVPENPLGVRALYLGSTLFRIHGTNEPQSIGSNASSGCIRMHNEHVIHLYERVPVGSVVRVYRNEAVPGVGASIQENRLHRPGLW